MNEEHKIKAGIKNDTTPIRGNMTEDARPASTSARGIIRIATDEEALVGENTNTAITPHTLELKTSTYIYEQGVAANTWTIEHNLNKYPSVSVTDTAGHIFFPAVEYVDKNTIIISHNGSFKGKAYLN